MSCPIYSIYDDLSLEIFQYVYTKSNLEIRLTCKKWNHLLKEKEGALVSKYFLERYKRALYHEKYKKFGFLNLCRGMSDLELDHWFPHKHLKGVIIKCFCEDEQGPSFVQLHNKLVDQRKGELIHISHTYTSYEECQIIPPLVSRIKCSPLENILVVALNSTEIDHIRRAIVNYFKISEQKKTGRENEPIIVAPNGCRIFLTLDGRIPGGGLPTIHFLMISLDKVRYWTDTRQVWLLRTISNLLDALADSTPDVLVLNTFNAWLCQEQYEPMFLGFLYTMALKIGTAITEYNSPSFYSKEFDLVLATHKGCCTTYEGGNVPDRFVYYDPTVRSITVPQMRDKERFKVTYVWLGAIEKRYVV